MKEKEVKEERMEERKEKVNEKGVVKMEKERKEERMEVKKNNENKKGGCKMKEKEGIKEVKELVKEIETKKLLLVTKVVEWAENLHPVKDTHIKIKGRYYPLLGKDGKLYLIDKVQSKKRNFDTLEDQNMKFVVATILAERKEEIEKEVEEGKRKYLEGKAAEIDKLLLKF